jgi:hypothetical protein
MKKNLTRSDFLKVGGGSLASVYLLGLTGCGGGGGPGSGPQGGAPDRRAFEGETLSHQSVLVRFDGRTVILAADAIVLRETLEGVQGVWRDPEAGAESVRRLVRLAERENAELLVGHDPVAWAEWPHAPKPFA